MWMKPAKWIMEPKTKYEIRREMNVRESQHTCMLFDKRYYNVESGKFITDKLHTLNTYSLADLCVTESADVDHLTYLYKSADYSRQDKWFTPKDNDFDLEEIKPTKPTKPTISIPKENITKVEEDVWFNICKERKEKEKEYQKQLAEVEKRIEDTKNKMNELATKMYLGGPLSGQYILGGYISSNKWIPK